MFKLLLTAQTRRLPKLRATQLILLTAFLSLVLLYIISPYKLYNNYRYPPCGHIVVVSTQRHGATWFLSNAEGCLSINGSFGRLSARTEVWNRGGAVQNITVDQALDLVRHKTSVKITPHALYESPINVRTFFRHVKAEKIPVFVLRRLLIHSWSSYHAAQQSNDWNADTGGKSVGRGKFKDGRIDGKTFDEYKDDTRKYFGDATGMMREVGLEFDELMYGGVTDKPWIYGKKNNCYIRNCNF